MLRHTKAPEGPMVKCYFTLSTEAITNSYAHKDNERDVALLSRRGEGKRQSNFEGGG